MLVLFYWDGTSSIVQDVDYFLWGDYDKGFSKTVEESDIIRHGWKHWYKWIKQNERTEIMK